MCVYVCTIRVSYEYIHEKERVYIITHTLYHMLLLILPPTEAHTYIKKSMMFFEISIFDKFD